MVRGNCGKVKGAEMNKETTIYDWVNFIKREVCSKCKFYNKKFDICCGEILPMERAIMRNLDGRGTCKNIKEFAEQLKAGRENE